MDLGDALWVTHASFRTLEEEEELVLCNYFQSGKKSGGGPIQSHKRVPDSKGHTTALLIYFSDPQCE